MLPSPMAHAAARKMNPSREPSFSRSINESPVFIFSCKTVLSGLSVQSQLNLQDPNRKSRIFRTFSCLIFTDGNAIIIFNGLLPGALNRYPELKTGLKGCVCVWGIVPWKKSKLENCLFINLGDPYELQKLLYAGCCCWFSGLFRKFRVCPGIILDA